MLADDLNMSPEKFQNYYENPTSYILHYGFPIPPSSSVEGANPEQSREDQHRSFKAQDEAYLRVQSKVGRREDKGRALLISANVLSISIMASQLRLYRWRVSEAQTITQATSILQDEVFQAIQKGYCVSRRRTHGADLDGNEIVNNKGNRTSTFSRYAHKKESEIRDLFNRDRMNGERNAERVVAACDTNEDGDDKSMCSAELDIHQPSNGKENRRHLKDLPGDAITRLVIVDSFTHESFTDIMEYLRYFNNEYGLELVVVLLLHNPHQESLINTEQAQGAGLVLVPQSTITPEEAYACGYDLVLAHHFDHIVVDLLTQTFITASGRWRNDIRSRAAVGNYASMRSILMGKLHTDQLRQLAWDNSVDADEILDVLSRTRGSETPMTREENLNKTSNDDERWINVSNAISVKGRRENTVIPKTLSRLRVRDFSTVGVKSVTTKQDEISSPLKSAGLNSDILNQLMNPTEALRCVQIVENGAKPNLGQCLNEDIFTCEEDEYRAQFLQSFEKEIHRLVTENAYKQREIEALRSDLHNAQHVMNTVQCKCCLRAHDKVLNNSVSNQDSISITHLSKEQQVYVLKERLDMANETIEWLMNEYSPASSSSFSSSRRRARSSGGENMRSIVDRKRMAVLVDIRRNELLASRKRRASRAYLERREEELMACKDFDAVASADDAGANENGSTSVANDVGVDDFVLLRMKRTPTQLAEECRERALLDNLTDNLQRHVKLLRCTETSSASPDHSSLLLLESALEQIHLLKGRIQHLEEIQIINEAWYRKYVEKERHFLKKKDKKSDKQVKIERVPQRPPKSVKVQPEKGNLMQEKKQQVSRPAEQWGRQTINTHNTGSAKVSSNNSKTMMKPSPTISAETHAAVEDKMKALHVPGENDYHEKFDKIGPRLYEVLARLYTKARRPYTITYRKLLEAEHTEAKQQAHRLWSRLQSLLDCLPASHPSVGLTRPISPKCVKLSLLDRGVRLQIDQILKEWSRYISHAEHVALALKNFNEDTQKDIVRRLVERRQSLLGIVKDTEVDLKSHSDALKDLAAVELKLSMWSDIDISQHLDRNKNNQAIEVSLTLSPCLQSRESSPRKDTMVTLDIHHFIQDMREILEIISAIPNSHLCHNVADIDSRPAENGSIGKKKVKGVFLSLPDIDSLQPKTELLQSDKGLAILQDVVASPAQRALYSALFQTYANGFVHPDRMVDLNDIVCLRSNAASRAVPCPSNRGGDAEQVRGVNTMQLKDLYWSHHQELIRLLRLLSLGVPTVRFLLSPYFGEIETMLSHEFCCSSEDNEAAGPRSEKEGLSFAEDIVTTKISFLVAADSALISTCVDTLGTLWEMQLNQEKLPSSFDVDELKVSAEALHHLVRSGTRRHPSRVMKCEVEKYYQTRWAAIEALHEMRKEHESISQGRNFLNEEQRGWDLQSTTIDGLKCTELPLPETSAFLLPSGPANDTESEYTADELAALFRMKPQSKSQANPPTRLQLEDIYLDSGIELDVGNSLIENDENRIAMQRIEAELVYLDRTRKQRLEELEVRRRYEVRKRLNLDHTTPNMQGCAKSGAKCLGSPTAGDMHNFEVKGGCPAWYGMEASKRVRHILRRRAKPDQIILNADPTGGGLGIELSRRTAMLNTWLNQTNQKSDVLQDNTVADAPSFSMDRIKKHHTQSLPRLSQRGLSSWHKLPQRAVCAVGPNKFGNVETDIHLDKAEREGYTCPRDCANLRAFHNIASRYNSESSGTYQHTPTTLLERLAKYRDVVRRAAARLGLGNPFFEESFGGLPPYVVAVQAGSPSLSSSCEKLSRQEPSSRVKLPNLSSSTYGIGDADLQRMLNTPTQQRDSLVFLPTRNHTTFVMPTSHKQCGDKDGAPSSPPSLSKALRPNVEICPSWVATQRLTFLLRTSIANPVQQFGNSLLMPSIVTNTTRGQNNFWKQSNAEEQRVESLHTPLSSLRRTEIGAKAGITSAKCCQKRSSDGSESYKFDSTMPKLDEEVLEGITDEIDRQK